MYIEQLYTGCLAQAAYYIESEGEAVIIDPLRDVTAYIRKAAKEGAKIKYIFETHFHADFVSGHQDLAARTGATIVYGPGAQPQFDAYIAQDQEIFAIGDHRIWLLHTPGHTMESCCLLLQDAAGKDLALFTGDTLFIGDVGRPDLVQLLHAGLTQDKLAGLLYDSLHRQIMPLSDDILVYPGHGAGSACGKQMSRETVDTLGHQKRVNYALQPMSRECFIQKITEGLTPPPAYFPEDVLMNIRGSEPAEQVLARGLKMLPPDVFLATAAGSGALVLDTRSPESFCAGFIPGALYIGLDGDFAPWAGTLIRGTRHPLLLVADEGRAAEAVTRLARVGYDHVLGCLEGGMMAWIAAGLDMDTIATVSPRQMAARLMMDAGNVALDVRRRAEYDRGHVPGAVNVPLEYVSDREQLPDGGGNRYVYCAGGYRSVIFISLLLRQGRRRLVNVAGGYNAIREKVLQQMLDPAPVAIAG